MKIKQLKTKLKRKLKSIKFNPIYIYPSCSLPLFK